MRKKKKHPSVRRRSIEDRLSPSMHLRLCHRCLYLNEGSKFIDKCQKCESRFTEAPAFEKDFNPDAEFQNQENPIQEALTDFDSEHASDEANENTKETSAEQEDETEQDEDRTRKGMRPISGLSVLW